MDQKEHSRLIMEFEQFAETLKTHLTESSPKTRVQFLKFYYEWSEVRRKTIQDLKHIAEALDRICHGSNVARLTGSSVGIVGGLLVIAGAVLTPFTAGVSVPVAISGAVAMGLGASTTATAGATKTITYKINKMKVEAGIEQDYQITEKLLNVIGMSRSKQILEVLQDIKEYITESQLLESAYKTIVQELYAEIENCLKKCNAIKVQKIINLLLLVVGTGKNSISHVRPSAIIGEVTSAIRCAGTVATLARNNPDFVRAVAPKLFVGVGALGAVSVAFNIVDMVFTSIEVHKGSQSPYASDLKKCIESLNEEMTVVQSLKDSLLANRE